MINTNTASKRFIMSSLFLFIFVSLLHASSTCHYNEDNLVLWKDDFGSVPEGSRKECSYLKGHKFLKDIKKSVDDGQYAVVSRMKDAGTWFAAMDGTDHTGNADGGFLVINIDKNYKGKVIYEQTLGFTTCVDKSYYFSIWASSISKRVANGDKTGVLCDLTLEIVDAETDAVLGSIETNKMPNAPTISGQIPWVNYGVSFISKGEKVKLRIFDHAGNGDKGNDLALDDISLIACEESAPRVFLSVDGKDDVSGVCNSTVYTLSLGDISPWKDIYDANQIYCLWQKSLDGGESWETIEEASGLAKEKGSMRVTAMSNMQTINDSVINIGIRYRVIVAGPKSEVTEQIAKQGYPNDGCYLYRISNVMTVSCGCDKPEFERITGDINMCMNDEKVELTVKQQSTAKLDSIVWYSKTINDACWKFEKKDISPAVSNELFQFEIEPTDSMRVLFLAYNGECASDSIFFMVNVDKPIVLKPLKSSVLCEGSDTTYIAEVLSGYPLTYEWNGVEANKSFNISNIDKDISLSLVAKGSVCKSEPVTATVKVENNVVIADALDDIAVCGSKDIRLDSKSVAKNIQWFSTYSGGDIFHEIKDANGSVYEFFSDSTRSYKVVAWGDKCPSKELVASVKVFYPSSLACQIDKKELCVGDRSVITVSLENVSKLKWMQKIQGEDEFSLIKETTHTSKDKNVELVVTPEVSMDYSVIVVTDNETICPVPNPETLSVKVEDSIRFNLATSSDQICLGDEVDASIDIVSGDIDYIEWTKNGIKFSDVSEVHDKPVAPNNYYEVILEGKICPSSNKSFIVKVEAPAEIKSFEVKDSKICLNSEAKLSLNQINSKYLVWERQEEGGVFEKFSESMSMFVYDKPSVKSNYRVRAFGNVCPEIVSDVVSVEIEDSVKVYLSPDTTICESDEIKIEARVIGTPQSIGWYCGNELLSSGKELVVAPGNKTTYSFTASSDKCPDATAYTTVNVDVISAKVEDITLCEGDSSYLKISTREKCDYKWYDDAEYSHLIGNSDRIRVSPAQTTQYYVVASNSFCNLELSPVVKVVPIPVIIGVEEKGQKDMEIMVEGGEGTYEYNYGSDWSLSNILENYSYGKDYNVRVRDEAGCVVDTIITTPNFEIEIPTVITPNGDGVNDAFNITNFEKFPLSTIKIYDRFGKLVVKSKANEYIGWDGMYNGNKMPSTDYWYEIWIEELDKMYVGHVTLLWADAI